jgi:pimeloyl-ACP methyl ester carboxylesterase
MTISLKPPASLLLVHGAGSGPWVYKDWADTFSHTVITAIDLQEGINVACASMTHYADRVVAAAVGMEQPVAIVGWSMGGLVVMLAVQRLQPHSVILLEASAPSEIQGSNLGVELVEGVFDPEAVYGFFPVGMQARPESSLARAERERGISVPSLPCPALVIYGEEFRRERGEAIAHFYHAHANFFHGCSHWDLVLDPKVRSRIAEFLGLAAAQR